MDLTWVGYALGVILTLVVLLYLIWPNNPLFRMVIYAFIGIAAGYVAVLVVFQVLWPRIGNMVFSTNVVYNIIGLVTLVLGLLLFFKLSPRLSAIGTIPVAILAGIGGAVAVGGAVFGTLFGQMNGTFAQFPSIGAAFAQPEQFFTLLGGLLTLVGVICTLVYFQFSVPGTKETASTPEAAVRRALPLEIMAVVGQVFIGITLGSIFAGVFTAAISTLVERLGFIIDFVARLLQA